MYLIIKLVSIYIYPCPYRDFNQLIFVQDEWRLFDKYGAQFNYQKHRLILDCGLFFLMELSHETKHRVMVIFFDQLSLDDYRSLQLIEKIR